MKRFCLLVVVCFVAVAFGCQKEKGAKLVPIGEINKHPEKYAGQEVVIHGTVTKTALIGGKMCYLVVSDSGSMFVVPRKKVPPALTKVRMRVAVMKDYKIGTSTRKIALVEKWYLHVEGKKGKGLMEAQKSW